MGTSKEGTEQLLKSRRFSLGIWGAVANVISVVSIGNKSALYHRIVAGNQVRIRNSKVEI